MKNKSKLDREEYQELYTKYYDENWSQAKISRHLGRSKSCISRALNPKIRPQPGSWNLMSSHEKGSYMYRRSRERMSKGRERLRLKNERIRKLVGYILCRWHWSPEVISNFLKKHGLKISGKSIYRFIKKERSYFKKYLRLRGKTRRQRVMHPRSFIKAISYEKKSIHDRPSIYVNNQIEAGHWHIDTVLSGRSGFGGVCSLRELASKRNFFFLLSDLKAETLMRVIIPFFHTLPAYMKKTQLADNGAENSDLYKLEKIFIGFNVYYCDPYKAWQRAEVENGNGDLRWHFPKKTDFSKVTPEELRAVDYKISYRPMKTNNWISPRSFFNQLLKAA